MQEEQDDRAKEWATIATNSKLLYDTVMTARFDKAAVTVEWMPSDGEMAETNAGNLVSRKLITGTVDGCLKIYEVKVPGPQYDGYYWSTDPFRLVSGVSVESEINRARYMPQRPNIVGVKCQAPEVLVVGLVNPPVVQDCGTPIIDNLGNLISFKLSGHSDKGFGLSWNPLNAGQLLSGSRDGLVCIWDVNQAAVSESFCTPIRQSSAHMSAVNDVCWNFKAPALFASVGDDGQLVLEDIRAKAETPVSVVQACDGGKVGSVAFNLENGFILLTGSSNGEIKVWDRRKLSEDVHMFECGNKEICTLAWNPAKESVFAAGDSGAKVTVYDLTMIGEPIEDILDDDDGPEKLFVHAFHAAKVTDIAWSKEIPWLIASVCEGSMCTLWKMTSDVYEENSIMSTSSSELDSILNASMGESEESYDGDDSDSDVGNGDDKDYDNEDDDKVYDDSGEDYEEDDEGDNDKEEDEVAKDDHH